MIDVIIIGAGAAGLMAAKLLSAAGLQVSVLEARERIGGRVFTVTGNDANKYEGGAEFIHGNLEVTLQLLKEAGLKKQELTGETWQFIEGKLSRDSQFFEDADKVIEKLKLIDQDISIADFMDKYFSSERHDVLRSSLTSYVEGYYSGEVSKTSSKSFLEEWLSEDDQQYRPVGGYGKLIKYLQECSLKAGAEFRLRTVVREIKWRNDSVEVVDQADNSYTAKKAIVTVPLGVWTAEENAEAAIVYTPTLPGKKEAAKQMGFGSVIKALLKFEKKFYEEHILKAGGADLSALHMIITDRQIPTWWTQYPNSSSLLTGWLSGPNAAKMKNENDEAVLEASLSSLQDIFDIDQKLLKQNMQWFKIFNWTVDPFTRGSYSYSTLQTANARKALVEPVENTLFFAGEALYDGPEMGTVEAALTSGRDVAQTILAH